jgi:DNA-binding IclR family transcriptional regulator
MAGVDMQALDRFISILETVAAEREPVSAADVAEATGLSISTASRLLLQFADAGLLHRASRDRRYVLGPRLYRLARTATEQLDVTTIARPELERLRDRTGETASLHVLRGSQRVCILEVPSLHQVRRVVPVGQGAPIAGSATGAVLLAGVPRDEQRHQIDELDLPGDERKRFERLVAQAMADGWAIVEDEWVQGLCGLSALIPDGGWTPAALSVSGPSTRFTRNAAESQVEAILDAARTIARHVGTAAQ